MTRHAHHTKPAAWRAAIWRTITSGKPHRVTPVYLPIGSGLLWEVAA